MRTKFLPRCVSKYHLVTYFGCDYRYLWSQLLTEERLASWGYDQDDVKPDRVYGPDLTRRIYLEWGITDLNSDFSEEIASELAALRAN